MAWQSFANELGEMTESIFSAINQQEETLPFSDVPEEEWYYDYVKYAYENGLFSGTSTTTFSPSSSMTRGMFVTVLGGGLAEEDKNNHPTTGVFEDVLEIDYFAPYVYWAYDRAVTSGTSETTFSPNRTVNREEMALFIVAYYGEMGYEFPDKIRDTYPNDWDTVSSYAQEAVLTMWSCGMLTGDDLGNFNPKNPSKRSEVAAFTYRVNEHLIEMGVKESIYANESEEDTEEPEDTDSSDTSDSDDAENTDLAQVSVTFALGKDVDSSLVTLPSAGKYSENTPISALPQAEISTEKALYSFGGWFYNDDCTQTANEDVLTESVTLYAKVGQIQTANLSFALVSGGNNSAVSFSNKTLYPTGTAFSTIAPPELESGYFFMGWFLDASGVKSVGSQYLTVDTTIYAKVISLSQGEGSYQVSFACGEGVETNLVTLPTGGSYPQGYDLTLLPEPTVEAGIFLGWYTDSSCNNEATGTLSKNQTVYGLVQELGAMAIYTPHFLSVEGTGVNYTFQVWGNSEEEIRQALSILDVTAENAEIIYSLTYHGDGIYTVSISGYQEGTDTVFAHSYEEGHIYKATLPENSGVCFVSSTGEVQGNSVRELNFSIAKANVQNLQLNQDLIYIPNSEVSNFTGDTGNGIMGIDVVSGDVTATIDVGAFTYTKGSLSLGDTVAIYEGIHPSSRTVTDALTESQDDWIVYGTITDVGRDGNYAYVTPDSTEVLFTPDILPVSATLDLVTDDGNIFTIYEEYLDFTDYDLDGDDLGLSGDTTIDVGDFLAIYEESTLTAGSIANYARIDQVYVELVGGKTCYVISYTFVTEAELMEAMDLHTEAVDQDMSLTEEEISILEQEIVTEALSSGFAEMVAESIGQSLLDEDGYENLAILTGLDQLEAHTTLKELSVNTPEGFTVETLSSVGVGVSAKAQNITASAVVYTGNLVNLGGTGLTLELSISFEYAIDCGDGLKVVLEVEAIFVQEVEFSVSVSGGAVWKWKWFIPYISDYRLNTSINVGTYTGVGLMGSIQLKAESNFLQDAFNYLQGKGSKTGPEKLSSIADTVETLIDAGNFFNLDESDKENLENEYSDLLKSYSGNWVEVYTKNIVEQRGFVPGTLCILAYGVDIDFVVSVRASVQLGMSFEYSNAKSYVFSISLFGKSATSETIDRVTSNYMFNFYTIGTLGVRAGIRLTVRVGLLHVDLLSMGVQAEVGGYCQVWGYFYYRYAWESGQGSTSYKGGAFFLDMGIYLDINFCATAVGLNASVPLYSKEWPLFSIGEYLIALDFTTAEEGFDDLAYFGSKTLLLPSYVQEMQTQNLKTGDLGSEDIDWDKFTMKFSNPVFSWNKSSEKIIVSPASGQIEATTDFTITYDNALDLNGAITRHFQIFWMDPDNANIYNFDSNGGSYTPTIAVGFSEPLTVPDNPTKTGYTFAGWYQDEALTQSYTFPSLSHSSKQADVFLYGKWTPAPSPYTVEYYEQNLYGRYELISTEIVNADRSNWSILAEGSASHHSKTASTGFSYEPSLSTHSHDSIQGIGSLVVQEYFSRNEYSITFTATETGYAPLVYPYLYEYTTVIPNSLFYYAGYDFDGWISTDMSLTEVETLSMPAKDMTFSATWSIGDSYYQVEHYLQQENGTYALGEMTQTLYDEDSMEEYQYVGNAVEYYEGKTDVSVAELSYLTRDFLTYTYTKATGNGSTISGTLPTIAGDNSTLIRLFYERNMTEVMWDSDGGTLVDNTSVHEGKEITLPTEPTKTGYVFVEWQDENGIAFVTGTTIDETAMTYKAVWSAGEGTEYKVKHIRQNIDATYPDYGLLVEEDTFYGTTDSSVTPSAKTYDGFTSPTATTHSVFPDGSLLIVYEYSRNTYQISYDVTGGDDLLSPVSSYLYGEGTTSLPSPSKLGYIFSHWTLNGTQVSGVSETEFGDVTLVAVWEPDGNTAYQVEHYTENLSGGGYTLDRTTSHIGATEEIVEAAQENITGFTYNALNSSNISTGEILPDGSLMLKLYYSRNEYQVAWYDYDTTTELQVDTYKYEEVISAPNITASRQGYTFGVWENYASIMDTADLSYNGKNHGTWTANTYTISYELQGGTASPDAPNSYVYEVGTALVEPTRAGYTFQYWTVGGTQVTEITTTDIENITLVANWAVAGDTPYKVQHYTQELTGGYSLYQTVSNTGATEDTATASQLSITGFTYDSNHADKVESDIIVGDGSLVLKLYYSRNSYTVHWYDYSGGSLESVSYLYEEDILTTDVIPTRTGHTFGGWSGIASNMGIENLSYYAETDGSWTANTYSISYNTDGGTLPIDAITSYTYGVGVDLPVPTKTGYTFNYWSDGTSNITVLTATDLENKSLTAKWIANTGTAYSIEHYVQDLGATTYTKTETQNTSGTTGATATGSAKTYTGFTYDNTISGTVASGQIAGDGSLVLKLYYKRNTYSVTWYDYNKTTILGTSSHEYQSSITPPNTLTTASRTGYTFASWNVSETMGTTAQTFNAYDHGTWTTNSYTIAFHENGGTGTMASLSMTYDTAKNLTANSFTRTGYTFVGWSTTESGSAEYGAGESVTNLSTTQNGTVTLYAVWSTESYTISYAMGGKGTVDENFFSTSYTVESGTVTLPTGYVYINGLYRLTGWTASSGTITANGTDYTFTPSSSGGNVTLTAEWKEYYQITTNYTGEAEPVITDVDGGGEITITPTEGMYLTAVKVTNQTTGATIYTASRPTVDSFSFTMPSASVVVTATQEVDRNPTFNSGKLKAVITDTATKVTFTTEVPAGVTTTDISSDGNGGVLVWSTAENEYTVGVANIGKVAIPPASMSQIFSGYSALKEADLNAMDTSAVYSLYQTFMDCSNLTTLKIGDWDTSNMGSLSKTFYGCSSLTNLDIGDWDTSRVSSLYYTFAGCSSFTSMDLSKWKIADDITYSNGVFMNCTSLKSLKFGYCVTEGATFFGEMFYGCSALTKLDLSGLYVSDAINMSYTDWFVGTTSSLKLYYSASFNGEQNLLTNYLTSSYGFKGTAVNNGAYSYSN